MLSDVTEVWKQIQINFKFSFTLFVFTIILGIWNSESPATLPAGFLLIHIHTGTLAWIFFLLFTLFVKYANDLSELTEKQLKQFKMFSYYNIVVFTLYILSFYLALNFNSLVMLLAIMALLAWGGIVQAAVLTFTILRGLSKKNTGFYEVFASMVMAVLAGAVGLERAVMLGLNRMGSGTGDIALSHAVFMNVGLVLLGVIGFLHLALISRENSFLGKIEMYSLIFAAVMLSTSYRVYSIPMFVVGYILLLLGLGLFFLALIKEGNLFGKLMEVGESYLGWSTLFIIIYFGIQTYILTLLLNSGFPLVSNINTAAFHSLYLGVATNFLLGAFVVDYLSELKMSKIVLALVIIFNLSLLGFIISLLLSTSLHIAALMGIALLILIGYYFSQS